jgi:ribose 5-phosphate isomerase A
MNQDALKQQVGQAALSFVKEGMMVGVGTGSTTRYFMEALATMKDRIAGTVASSVQTEQLLKSLGIPVFPLLEVDQIDLYVDGADEVDPHGRLIKGGGAALTREKILSFASKKFVCIIDKSKQVPLLGKFPVPVEVIPMARSIVAKAICSLGGDPSYRVGVTTDNGNILLDIHHFQLTDPQSMETKLNQIPGVVCNGIFSFQTPQVVLVGSEKGVEQITF